MVTKAQAQLLAALTCAFVALAAGPLRAQLVADVPVPDAPAKPPPAKQGDLPLDLGAPLKPPADLPLPAGPVAPPPAAPARPAAEAPHPAPPAAPPRAVAAPAPPPAAAPKSSLPTVRDAPLAPAVPAVVRGAEPLAQPSPPGSAPTGLVRGGAHGALSRPTLAPTEPGRVAVGFAGDFYRGGDFLLPGATTQRAGGLLGLAWAPNGWLEVYGALALRASKLTAPGTSTSLSSVGDADLGLRVVLPAAGPLTVGALLQLDLPAGVGSVTLKGTGGRASLLAALAGKLGPVPLSLTASGGYVLDNTHRLTGDQMATFPTFALDLSLYDRVESSLTLQAPFALITPAVEVVLEVPVARTRALPAGGQTVRSRLLLGFTSATGVEALALTVGLSLSLVRTGRIEPGSLAQSGLAPDPPWTALLGLAWSFEPKLPAPSREVRWHGEPKAGLEPKPESEPASSAGPLAPLSSGSSGRTGARGAGAGGAQGQPVAAEKGRLSILVLDARSEQPVPGAWVSVFEADDAGATTGADGRVRLEALPGPVTLAVAREGYEPFTEPATSIAGQERSITALLLPVQADAHVRGRIFGEDGELLRAALSVQSASAAVAPAGSGGVIIAGATSSAAAALAAVTAATSGAGAGPGSVAAAEAMVFEGTFTLPLAHGSWLVSATAPGFRAEPLKIDLRPGETVSRDLVLRRIAGEPVAKVSASGARVELARRIAFASSGAALLSSSQPVLAALASALRGVSGPITLAVRVEPSDLGVGADDAVAAQQLSDKRAEALVEALVALGVPRTQLSARGLGLARPGQTLLEVRLAGAGRG